MKFKLLLYCTFFTFSQLSYSQNDENEFILGMFGPRYQGSPSPGYFQSHHASSYFINLGDTIYRSDIEVFSDDGFNTLHYYQPTVVELDTVGEGISLLKFLHKYYPNLNLVLDQKYYFEPNLPPAPFDISTQDAHIPYDGVMTGNTVLNSVSPNHHTINARNRFDDFYSREEYRDILWGHYMTEEASAHHAYHYDHDNPSATWHCDCNNEGSIQVLTEVPPQNVQEAIDSFRHYMSQAKWANTPKDRLIISEAAHGGTINDSTHNDTYYNLPGTYGEYNPPDYGNLDRNADVFLDISYYQIGPSNFPDPTSYNEMLQGTKGASGGSHYLGRFKTIDWTIEKGMIPHTGIFIDAFEDYKQSLLDSNGYMDTTAYQSEYYSAGSSVNRMWAFHTNNLTPNGNVLWFEAYTSIIHGSKGIWFWGIDQCFEPTTNGRTRHAIRTKGKKPSWVSTYQWIRRLQRENFSELYQDYVGLLSRELRYLIENGLIGTNPEITLYQKLDQSDPNCIVGAPSTYMPTEGLTQQQQDELISENYGLRYTINTNGQDVIMIISNPLVTALDSVPLSFTDLSNEKIRNSIGVEILFNDGSKSVGDLDYKIERNFGTNWSSNDVGDTMFIPFTPNKEIFLDFGPLDVHVLRFKQDTSYSSSIGWGWDKEWTNNGSDWMGHVRLDDSTHHYVGDFNGDSEEEVLSFQINGPYVTLQKYNNSTGFWNRVWYTNLGTNHPIHQIGRSGLVGDFDGDGTDELFGESQSSLSKMMFEFNGSDFVKIWDDSSNTAIQAYDQFFNRGDYSGLGQENLLAANDPGWVTEFVYDGTEFNWTFSDYGHQYPLQGYQSNMYSGDFNGDGLDEVLGFGSSNSQVVRLDTNQITSPPIWSKPNGSTNFGGWNNPPAASDIILVGQLDNDAYNEVFVIQTGTNAAWATSFDLSSGTPPNYDWSWNWWTDPALGARINDWKLKDTLGCSNTYYKLVRVNANEPDHLLAFRTCDICQTNKKFYAALYRPTFPQFKAEPQKKNQVITSDNSQPIIYPNPSRGRYKVQWHHEPADSHVQITIYDPLGKVVSRYTDLLNSELNFEFIIEEGSGLYFIVMSNGNSTYRLPVMKID